MKQVAPSVDGVTKLWWGGVLLLSFILPFEVVTPWLHVDSALVMTNVELLVFLTIGIWLARLVMVREKPVWQTPITFSTLLLLLVFAVVNLLAPSDAGHAWKVMARWVAGVVTGLMILNAFTSGLAARHLILANVLGGVVVSLLGIGEVWATSWVQPILAPFRINSLIRVGEQIRASSTLDYPTIAAMYLEMIFILGAGRLATLLRRPRTAPVVMWLGLLSLVALALVLTFTRSAFIAIGGAFICVALWRWREFRADAWLRASVIAGSILALILAAVYLSHPLLGLRLVTEDSSKWYRANVSVPPLSIMQASETLTVTARIENKGQRVWQAASAHPIRLSYNWLTPDHNTILQEEGLRTSLPRDLAPGDSATLFAGVRAPSHPGSYILAWNLVSEGLFWFSDEGSAPYEQSVLVQANASTTDSSPLSTPYVAPRLRYDRLTLWRAAINIFQEHPFSGVGVGNFRFWLGKYVPLDRPDLGDHANSIYFEMLADTGVLGVVAFAVWLVTILALIARGSRSDGSVGVPAGTSRASSERSLWIVTLGTAIVAFFIHGVTDYFFEFTAIYLQFWMVLGLLTALVRSPRDNL